MAEEAWEGSRLNEVQTRAKTAIDSLVEQYPTFGRSAIADIFLGGVQLGITYAKEIMAGVKS